MRESTLSVVQNFNGTVHRLDIYIVYTLYIHCIQIGHVHCIYIVYTLYIHCIQIGNIHYIYNVSTLQSLDYPYFHVNTRYMNAHLHSLHFVQRHSLPYSADRGRRRLLSHNANFVQMSFRDRQHIFQGFSVSVDMLLVINAACGGNSDFPRRPLDQDFFQIFGELKFY